VENEHRDQGGGSRCIRKSPNSLRRTKARGVACSAGFGVSKEAGIACMALFAHSCLKLALYMQSTHESGVA
jgi:hypothetical protein